MDKIRKKVHRLWGPLGDGEKLHSTPDFATEMAELCKGPLEIRSKRVSKWGFGEQVEHMYLVAHWVLDRMNEAMAVTDSPERTTALCHGMLIGHWIPRGLYPTLPELEAQGGTMEEIQPLKDRLEERLAKLDWTWPQVSTHTGRSYHPWMKMLLMPHWFFFLTVHHLHHLAILRDIRKKAD